MPRAKKTSKAGARSRKKQTTHEVPAPKTSLPAKSTAKRKVAKKALPVELHAKKKTAPGRTKKAAPRGDIKLRRAYRAMFQARLLDADLAALAQRGSAGFYAAAAGHEAIQCAAGLVFRAGIDWFYPYYRDAALVLTLGMGPQELALNVLSRAQDSAEGRARPLSFANTALHIAPQSPALGLQFAQAVGCALGTKLASGGEVVYVSSGEGACSYGDFWEALNWAAREALPVVFVVQRNGYVGSEQAAQHLPGANVTELAAGWTGLERATVDGSDLRACLQVMHKAHDRARKGNGPTLVEAVVPRLAGHDALDDQNSYRDAKELKREARSCPLAALKSILIREKILSRGELNKLEREVQEEVRAAVSWAEEQPAAFPSEAPLSAYTDSYPTAVEEDSETGRSELTFHEGIRRAVQEELRHNQALQVISHRRPAAAGGMAGALSERLATRVIHSPLNGAAAVGAAIGLAYRGYRGIVELAGAVALWRALPQLREAAAMMYRTNGHVTCPLVVRLEVGAPALEPVQHVEGMLAHLPGLVVLYPSNAADAKGLLKAALRGQDPVLCIEDHALYSAAHARAAAGNDKSFTPLGKAKVVREGSDVSVIAWGAQLYSVLAAAERVAEEGISVEVIDLRTIAPLDTTTVLTSLRKTARALIVHEDGQEMGLGAEIAAVIVEQCFEYLDAPVRRLAGKRLPFVPFAPALAEDAAPREQEIASALRSLAAY